MQSWGDGYVTDIAYADGFYPMQGPRQMALAALMRGLETPDFDGPFTYCELGCGRGRTSLVLAAVHPQGEFHAVDFHPAHIAEARQQAQAARLDNVSFHEKSFEELLGPDAPPLPMFDAVSLHGVWSWISPEAQGAIVAFLKARLKPGGLVFVSYNAMPTWLQVAPLQRMVKELADTTPGRSDVAADQAVRTLGRLFEAGVIPPQFEPGVKRISGHADQAQFEYLAHEYLNAHWRPVYHIDVVRALEPAKLSYAANSDLLRNFPILGLTSAQQGALAEVSGEALRETLTDFCISAWFRRDVFVRGARRLSADALAERASALELVSVEPYPDIVQLKAPDGTVWRPNTEVYRAIGQRLAKGPAKVGDLLSATAAIPGPKVGPVELVGVLVGTGLTAVHQKPDPAAIAAADRLNGLLRPPEKTSMAGGVTLAIPATSSGISLSAAEYTLFWAARRGPVDVEQAAREFVHLCRAAGGHPIIDGKPYEDEGEAVAAATRNYQEKLDRLLPAWRSLDLCDYS
jgi:SAM-dependent methyltransferase